MIYLIIKIDDTKTHIIVSIITLIGNPLEGFMITISCLIDFRKYEEINLKILN